MTRFRSVALIVALAPALVFAQTNTRCPNILLDFDISGSMSTNVSGTSTSRYVVGRDAVISLINANTANFRYGLILFGTAANSNCGVASCFYPQTYSGGTCESVLCGNGTTADITAVLNAQGPTGNTPTASSINTAMTRSDMQDTSRNRYIILITDGDPNCTGNTISDVETALTSARNAGVKTYILGFIGATAANLNRMAIAGGTNRYPAGNCDANANKCYYDASNATELNAALGAIVAAVGGELGGGSCDDTCYGGGCAQGQICKNNASGTPACVADPCANVSCPSPSVCVEGACKAPCDPACLSSEYCDNGVCKTKAPDCNPACTARNQTCVNGQCVENYCTHPQKAIACPSGALCIDNACQVFSGGTGGGSGGAGGTDAGRGGGAGGGSGGTNAGSGCCSGAPGAFSLFGLVLGLSALGAMRRRVRR